MHELSTTKSILDTVLSVAKEHHAGKVLEVNLEIGDLTFLNMDQIKFWFEILSEDTIVKGAVLNINKVPIKVKCLDCSYEGETGYFGEEMHSLELLSNFIPPLKCKHCGSINISVTSGKECMIKNIKLSLPNKHKK